MIRDDRPHGNDGAEVTLSLDDGEIYVRQDGPRNAPALLLIHGNASSARWWDELVPMLVAALVLINTGPHLGAHTAPPMAFDPSQWPDVSDEQLRQYMAPAFSRPGFQIPPVLFNEMRAMTFHSLTTATQASRDYVREQALPERLASLGKPLLVLFGEEDRRWRSSSAAGYRAVPGAIVEMLPGLGHTPILEDPARTASSLLAFTRSPGRAPAGAPPARAC